jgi:hypothetical protein
MTTRLRRFAPAAAFLAAVLLAPALRAQIPTPRPDPYAETARAYRDRVPHGFYISAQAVRYWGYSFPSGYYLETAAPIAPPTAYVLLDGMTNPKGATVPGFALGFTTGEEPYYGTFELSYSRASAPSAAETFTQVLQGADNSVETSIQSYTQTGRTISVLAASIRLGVFPFRGLDFAVYVSAGADYMTLSYQSAASAAIDALGYNTDFLKQGYLKDGSSADPATSQGGGAWSRGQFGFELGGGIEWFIAKRVGLRLDYRILTGSVKRKELITGAITVEADVRINYTFANRLAASVSYYF